MIKLLKCEFKKFRNTYVNSLSFLGMLMPLILILLVFIIRKDVLVKSNSYNWKSFNSQLSIFFVFLEGPIITSFIAVFSVFYEYQEKTMKNVLSSPFNRVKIILVKIIYVSVFILLQYFVVVAGDVLCAFVLGFKFSINDILKCCASFMVAGLSTIIIVPFMMFITLLFKSFIPGMVITVFGTISNVLVLNWEKAYLSPYATPALISSNIVGKTGIKQIYPITSTICYFVVFMIVVCLYFKRADQIA